MKLITVTCIRKLSVFDSKQYYAVVSATLPPTYMYFEEVLVLPQSSVCLHVTNLLRVIRCKSQVAKSSKLNQDPKSYLIYSFNNI